MSRSPPRHAIRVVALADSLVDTPGFHSQALDPARRGWNIINQNILLSMLIITALLPLTVAGALALAAAVLVHEITEVVVILNGFRTTRVSRPMES